MRVEYGKYSNHWGIYTLQLTEDAARLFFLRSNNTNIFFAFNKLFTAEIAKSAAVTANMKGKPLVNLEQETSV